MPPRLARAHLCGHQDGRLRIDARIRCSGTCHAALLPQELRRPMASHLHPARQGAEGAIAGQQRGGCRTTCGRGATWTEICGI